MTEVVHRYVGKRIGAPLGSQRSQEKHMAMKGQGDQVPGVVAGWRLLTSSLFPAGAVWSQMRDLPLLYSYSRSVTEKEQ